MVRVPPDKRLAWIPTTVAAAAALVLLGFVFPSPVQRLDEFLYDRAIRGSQVTPPGDVVIVAIDRASIERLGAWPWTAGIHAQLIQRLQAAGTPLIAFASPIGQTSNASALTELRAAMELLESKELGNSTEGEELKKILGSSVANLDHGGGLTDAIRAHGNVLLPIEVDAIVGHDAQSGANDALPDSAYATANAELLAMAPQARSSRGPIGQLGHVARALGHIGAISSGGGVVRTDQAVLRIGDHAVPSMALAIAAASQDLPASAITVNEDGLATIGRHAVQLADDFSWRNGFFATTGAAAIPEYPYWQVLSGEIGPDRLRGKTILVGLTDASDSTQLTPLGSDYVPVRFVASAVASLKLGRSFAHPAWADVVELVLILCAFAMALRVLPTLNAALATVISLLCAAALLFVEVGILTMTQAWLKLALPSSMFVCAAFATSGTLLFKRLRMQRGREADAVESLRMLGLTFQGQGQLDLAYETFRRCPADGQSMDLLYGIGQDFERRRQFAKAAEVYAHVASIDSSYKDVAQRRDRMRRADLAQGPGKQGGTPSRGDKNDPPTIPLPTPSASKGKQTLGRYELERELGKGAMGVVYLGRDPNINRVVAIKAIALAEEFAEEDLADARARFFREAEMAGRLNHPGIVTVYDAGEDRGLAYIAMEFLRGEHLSHYAEPIYLLPAVRVLSLAARVAEALDYAHKQNVVHRDIKPANIMFNKDTDELKITDFGIARLTDTSRTKTGIVLGTPSFMSPEQLEGRPLDGRSDLFALGITLYQLLTGQLPFRADSMTRLMQKIATEPHVPLRSLRPELPELAEQIVTRALAKSAADRYQTGAEFAAALRACVRLATRKEAVAR